MGTRGTSEGGSDVQFLDLGGHMDVFTWRKFIELHTDDSALSYRYVILQLKC